MCSLAKLERELAVENKDQHHFVCQLRSGGSINVPWPQSNVEVLSEREREQLNLKFPMSLGV